MIATWMLYAALIGGLVGVAAFSLERAASALRLPTRFIWAAALLLSVAWPILAVLQRFVPTTGSAVRVVPFSIAIEPVLIIARGSASVDRAALIDRGLVAIWILLSVIAAIRMVQALLVIRRLRTHWRTAQIDGMTVRMSADVGPAVVGLRRMDVVVPEWIATLDASLRAIVLRHEEEHRAARDPYLLFLAAIAVALMPWNVAVWLQARRLRLAIEMDCDARVLRAHPSPERYGLLMLTIAQRRSITPAFAAMLSEPSSQLERRILAMGSTTRRLARLTAAGATALAVGVLLFACALQSDNPVSPRPMASNAVRYNPSQTYFEFQVTKPVQAPSHGLLVRYPDMLRSANVEGEVLAQFVVDTLGIADMSQFKVLKSTHDLFTASVRTALPSMKFSPAELDGHRVKQLVQMPFQFNLSQDATPRRVRGEPLRVSDNQTYFDYQVESTVKPKTGAAVAPRYPDALRVANVEGTVLAQFVVDTSGQAVMETFKVLKSAHEGFSAAVLAALPDMRFTPAQVGGRPVKQLVQMPFTFSLSR